MGPSDCCSHTFAFAFSLFIYGVLDTTLSHFLSLHHSLSLVLCYAVPCHGGRAVTVRHVWILVCGHLACRAVPRCAVPRHTVPRIARVTQVQGWCVGCVFEVEAGAGRRLPRCGHRSAPSRAVPPCRFGLLFYFMTCRAMPSHAVPCRAMLCRTAPCLATHYAD